MRYVEPAARGLAMAQLVGIVIAVLLLVTIIAVGVVVVLLCCCRDLRSNATAPKEATDPVALVFADIESSTALWSAWSELMPDAVATHHRLIARYRSYGVKTIGDSCMVACKSAFAAVQLVRELQGVFQRHAWGTSALDDAYRKFEEGGRRRGRRGTCRRLRTWTPRCTGITGAGCGCVWGCTPGCATSGATR
ncbi:receptor-type adenylate cyclase [Trypanosoma rangeli]|uniref:Receptor-type adenylate cyclase n=1 Tax=Trypanosoma rangeli TaxID=5698 RepID=A0A422MZH7_TRYRA|nr:receptor-type adenylate cyclase [Trypanosoma rangeli]RNE98636.1 receptor-type adenylate cyclase [Trypanosoma rangeli]|eukprot:RNE98636.1 receptor-type adenylate cyclase [Trypanosoma rangeli]